MNVIELLHMLADVLVEIDAPEEKIDIWLNQIYDVRDSYIRNKNLAVKK